MKILVTGGAGYKGTILCNKLLRRGYDITILDNLMWGVKPLLHFIHHPKFHVIKGDIRNKELVKKEVKKADIIIHLAAIVGYPACAQDENRAKSTNIDGTQNIVEAIDNQLIIFASTGSTYGYIDGICTEETPINPLTLYGKTKSVAENMVMEKCKNAISLRFATVFGISPRMRLDLLVNDFCYQAIHNGYTMMYEGHHKRTFLHVIDAVNSYLFSMDNVDKMVGHIYNVGDDSMNFAKREIAEAVKANVPKFIVKEEEFAKDADQRNYIVSYDKIKSLGYEAKISLDTGIKEVLKVVPLIHIATEWRNA